MSAPAYELELFYDGDCPLCRREVAWLRERDRQGTLKYTNFAASDFDPASVGKTYDELMARLHGRLPDGTWLEGMEVARRLYAAAGFRRLAAFSRWPIIRQFFRLGYWLFARYRVRLTGRCIDGSCELPAGTGSNTTDHSPSR